MLRKHPPARTAITALVLLVQSSCASSRIQVGRDAGADFSSYETFSFARPDPESAPTQLDDFIKKAVSNELRRKGLEELRQGQPDLLVSYYAVLQTGAAHGKTPGPWVGYPEEEVISVKEGSFTLEFTDPRARKVVWQGTATDILVKPEDYAKQVDEAVNDLLRKYPAA